MNRLHRTMHYRTGFLAAVLVASLALGCSGPAATETPPGPSPAPELVLYNWGEYMPQSVLDAFAAEFGVKVNYVTFDSLEEALASLRSGKIYDVVVLDNDFVAAAIDEDLLAELDFSNIPNFRNVSPNFRDLSSDRGNKHSVPFNWGITALVVRTDLVPEPITSWADLWDPRLAGKIGVRQGTREMIGAALKSLGYSMNSEDPAELKAAEEHLALLAPGLVYVDPYGEGAVPQLLSGEIVVLIGWNQDAIMARDENPAVTYVFPTEGAMLWGDSLCIPVNSPNKQTAELFLNFMLRPEISAQVVNELYYPSANEAATPYIDPALASDPLVVPPRESLRGSEVLMPLSPAGRQMYDEILARILAGSE